MIRVRGRMVEGLRVASVPDIIIVTEVRTRYGVAVKRKCDGVGCQKYLKRTDTMFCSRRCALTKRARSANHFHIRTQRESVVEKEVVGQVDGVPVIRVGRGVGYTAW